MGSYSVSTLFLTLLDKLLKEVASAGNEASRAIFDLRKASVSEILQYFSSLGKIF
jgi:hypothetical protein